MHFSVRNAIRLFALVLVVSQLVLAADDGLIASTKGQHDMVPSTDPTISFWRATHPVYGDKGPDGQKLSRYRAAIRSRWARQNLDFLFICPFEQLNLNPSPSTTTETFRLWDWNVAEVFIGSNFQNIRRYKEFEISPQGEWIDLDIDLEKPHHEDDWTWNSGFSVSARIDSTAKIWCRAMRIPLAALDAPSPEVARRFRISLFRSQGPPPSRVQVEWQPVISDTFHVPDNFSTLRLVKEAEAVP